jgi:hypothetical protein
MKFDSIDSRAVKKVFPMVIGTRSCVKLNEMFTYYAIYK